MAQSRKRLVVISLLVLVVIACVGFASWTDIREIDKTTAKVRTSTYVLGIRWSHDVRETPFSTLISPTTAVPPEWTAIAGGFWGSRVSYRWSGIVTALHNVMLWMDEVKLPDQERRRVAGELLHIARRDDVLNVGYQHDRIVVYDTKGTLLLECLQPAP